MQVQLDHLFLMKLRSRNFHQLVRFCCVRAIRVRERLSVAERCPVGTEDKPRCLLKLRFKEERVRRADRSVVKTLGISLTGRHLVEPEVETARVTIAYEKVQVMLPHKEVLFQGRVPA